MLLDEPKIIQEKTARPKSLFAGVSISYCIFVSSVYYDSHPVCNFQYLT